MKNIMLSTAIVFGFAAAASAQGIEPVSTTTPNLDVTVGTQEVNPLLLVGAAVVIAGVILASGDETEGTR